MFETSIIPKKYALFDSIKPSGLKGIHLASGVVGRGYYDSMSPNILQRNLACEKIAANRRDEEIVPYRLGMDDVIIHKGKTGEIRLLTPFGEASLICKNEEIAVQVARVTRAYTRLLADLYQHLGFAFLGAEHRSQVMTEDHVRLIECCVPFEISRATLRHYHYIYYVPADDRVAGTPLNNAFRCEMCRGKHDLEEGGVFGGFGNLEGLQAQAVRGETPDISLLTSGSISLRADGRPLK